MLSHTAYLLSDDCLQQRLQLFQANVGIAIFCCGPVATLLLCRPATCIARSILPRFASQHTQTHQMTPLPPPLHIAQSIKLWWGYLRVEASGTHLKCQMISDSDGRVMDQVRFTLSNNVELVSPMVTCICSVAPQLEALHVTRLLCRVLASLQKLQ